MPETFKVVLLGDTNVGKTSLLTRISKDQFRTDLQPTIGPHFVSKVIRLPQSDEEIKLHIWDTAGQEKYRSLTPMYYRDAVAAIVVFDVTQRSTLDSAESWIKELKTQAPTHLIISLAGNKSDLYAQEEVNLEKGREFAFKNQVRIFQQTSAKDGSGVPEIFLRIAQEISRNKAAILENQAKVNVNLKGTLKKPKKKGGCCK